MKTCTITTGPKGEKCGKPAIVNFVGRYGVEFGECDEHAVTTGTNPAPIVVSVGRTVFVYHGGVCKVGTVVAVRKTRCDVRVAIQNGSAWKVITVPIAEVSVA